MNRTFWISASLAAALLAPTRAWEASVSQNIAVAIVKETIGLSPTSLAFLPQPPGVPSAAQTVTVSNTGAMAFPFSGVGVAGNNAADFAEANNCPTSLAVGASCLVSVKFAPATVGAKTASVVVLGPGGGTYTVALSGTAVSLSGTTIPSAVALGDGGGNVWTVSGAQIYRNGAVDPITGGVTLVLYYHGTIYQQANGAWYQLNTTSWPAGSNGWTWLSSGDPRTVSASGATIPSATDITDSSHNVYAVAGEQIYRNGIVDSVTANVTLLLYYNGTIYQQTSSGAWYQLTSTSWPAGSNGWTYLSSGDPRTAAAAPPCAGVAVTPASGIQNAVNANPAGTTFCLAAGTYHEAVIPKTNDVFQGANIGQTILDGQNTLGSAFASNGSAITGVTIKYLTVQHYTGFAAIFPSCCNGATGWVIDTVEVANNSQEGFDLAPSTTIQNSLIHNNALNGIHAANGGYFSGVITNNDISYNNTSNTSPCTGTADTAGIKIEGYGGPLTFTNNYDHDNSGNGLWFDLEVDNITISGNYFAHNTYQRVATNCGSSGAGFEVANPHGGSSSFFFHIQDNYFLDNGANFWLANSGNAEIYNNTMVVTNVGGRNLWYVDEGARTDLSYCGTGAGLCLVQNSSFHNNVIASTGDLVFLGQNSNTPGANWAGNGNSWTNNTYYLPSSTSALFNASGTLQTFAQWQAAGRDSGSTAIFNGGTLPSGVGTRGGFVCNPNMGTASGGLGVCP